MDRESDQVQSDVEAAISSSREVMISQQSDSQIAVPSTQNPPSLLGRVDGGIIMGGNKLKSSTINTGCQEVHQHYHTTTYNNPVIHHHDRSENVPMTEEQLNKKSASEKASSVDNVKQPISDFYETEKYREILGVVRGNHRLALQCHGIPGSGKSQLVQKLAQQFPYSDQKPELYVKWHIKCDDEMDNVQVKLKEMIEQMRKKRILTDNAVCQDVRDRIENSISRPLTDALIKANIPVLIIIDDVKNESQQFIKDFLRSLSGRTDTTENKLHIYVTSHTRSAIFDQDEIETMNIVKPMPVNGFNTDEGIRFLLKIDSESDTNIQTAAHSICDKFGRTPLVLRAIRAYCDRSMITLDKFSKCYEPKSLNQTARDRSVTQINEAMAILTSPFLKNESVWKTLLCISYLHHDCIPRFVLERFCRIFRCDSTNAFHEEVESGEIITTLRDYEMCTVNKVEEEITFHQSILRAFNLRSVSSDFKPFEECTGMLAGIITKDLRETKTRKKMQKLTLHIDTFLSHNEIQTLLEKSEVPFNGLSDQEVNNKKLLLLTISHIFEILGAISSGKPSSIQRLSSKYFQSALKIVCNILDLKEDEQTFITDFRGENIPDSDVVKNIVRQCELKGDELPNDFLDNYVMKIGQKELAISRIDFLKRHVKNQSNREVLQQTLSCSYTDFISFLRADNLFLPKEDHKKIFFAERLASILHSWSRVILYRAKADPISDNNYLWYSLLSNAISVKCREQYGVRLLSEYISTHSGKIPITIRLKQDPEAFLDIKNICENKLAKSEEDMTGYFENGMMADVPGSQHPQHRVLMLKPLVRVNTKLVKTQNSEEFISRADEPCSELLRLSLEQAEKLSSAMNSLIRCAKYYAATGNYDESARCFDEYFRRVPTSQTHGLWEMCNYARLVLCGKFHERKEEAITRCQHTLRFSDMDSEGDLLKLQKYVDELQEMYK